MSERNKNSTGEAAISRIPTEESIEENAAIVAKDAGSIAAVEYMGEEIDWLRTDLKNIKDALNRVRMIAETVEARTVAISSDIASIRSYHRNLNAEQHRMREAVVSSVDELRIAGHELRETRGEITTLLAQGEPHG